MNLTDAEREQTDNYVLDVKNTIYSNIINIIALPIVYTYIILFNEMVRSFTLPEMQVIAMFVWAYSVIKIIFAVSNINLEYKPREANRQ